MTHSLVNLLSHMIWNLWLLWSAGGSTTQYIYNMIWIVFSWSFQISNLLSIFNVNSNLKSNFPENNKISNNNSCTWTNVKSEKTFRTRVCSVIGNFRKFNCTRLPMKWNTNIERTHNPMPSHCHPFQYFTDINISWGGFCKRSIRRSCFRKFRYFFYILLGLCKDLLFVCLLLFVFRIDCSVTC